MPGPATPHPSGLRRAPLFSVPGGACCAHPSWPSQRDLLLLLLQGQLLLRGVDLLGQLLILLGQLLHQLQDVLVLGADGGRVRRMGRRVVKRQGRGG